MASQPWRPLVVTDESEEVSRQRRNYASAIGSFTPSEVIDDVVAFARDAELPGVYSEFEDDYWYEMLEKHGLSDKVGAIADAWSEEMANLQRAAAHVSRPIIGTGRSLIKKFGFCRFKPTSDQRSWYLHKDPGTDEEVQTMVFIALQDLGPHNGFPFQVARGQYVCIDGKASIITPPTGGGLAICLSIRL